MALNKETEHELDDLILELVYQGGMLERGKTINADMFPEARTALHRLILKERRKELVLARANAGGLKEYHDSRIAQIDSELERSSDG